MHIVCVVQLRMSCHARTRCHSIIRRSLQCVHECMGARISVHAQTGHRRTNSTRAIDHAHACMQVFILIYLQVRMIPAYMLINSSPIPQSSFDRSSIVHSLSPAPIRRPLATRYDTARHSSRSSSSDPRSLSLPSPFPRYLCIMTTVPRLLPAPAAVSCIFCCMACFSRSLSLCREVR